MTRIILPSVGDLRLGELTVGTLDRFLKTEAKRGLSRGRHARVVLAQILDLAVRIRRLLREHRREPGQPGPPPDGQLAQIFEVMLGTSARLGEALAIRRADVELDAEQPTVTITGTIVFVRGRGHVRQPHPKHSKYWRSIRDASAGLLPEGIDLAQVVPHTLRKTVATAIDDAAGTDLAAELLGHSSTAVTREHYVQPRNVSIPERLRSSRDSGRAIQNKTGRRHRSSK